jgi:HEXXH motif-containing protein
LLAERSPRRAAELANGLLSVTLLAPWGLAGTTSATCVEAFGGLATTMPRDSVEFAVVMVHEFQHSKLSALIALSPLCSSRVGTNRYFAPWKGERRPLSALIHGLYAFTAVASFWRDLIAEPGLHDAAVREFAIVRAQLRRALEDITADDPGLTAPGRRLVARIEHAVNSLARVAVPAAAEALARDRLAAAEG